MDVIKTPVHGISYLFRLSKNRFGVQRVSNSMEVEKLRGLYSKKTYGNYINRVTNLVSKFKTTVDSYRKNGYELIGYGAAAKGMTFLNFADVKLDYILDDNKLKHHLCTPGTNVPIKPNGFLKQYKETDKILFIPLAWNFYDEIQRRILKTRDNENDLFLKYFPEVKLERV